MFPGLNTKFNDFKCHIKIQDFFHTFPNFLLVGETGAFRTVKGGGGGGKSWGYGYAAPHTFQFDNFVLKFPKLPEKMGNLGYEHFSQPI